MYVEPNTVVKLLFGVPLNPTYEGTLTFNSRQEQYNYFNSKNPIPLAQYSYQRYEDGVICVEVPIARLYTCDYMMFQNNQYNEDRWFYAFVTNVEYVSETTTNVYYTIDVMQTWLLGQDWEFDNCFIEREHVNDDSIGSNTLPEPFEVGNMVLNKHGNVNNYNEYGLVISSYANIYFETNSSGEYINTVLGRVYIETDIGGTLVSTPFVKRENTVSNLSYTYIPFTTDIEQSLAVFWLRQLLRGDFWNSFNKYVVSVTVVPKAHVGEIYDGTVEDVGDFYGRTRTCVGYGSIDGTIPLMSNDYYNPRCKKLFTEQFMKVKLCGINGIDAVLPFDSLTISDKNNELKIPVVIEGGIYNGCGYRAKPIGKNSTYAGRALSIDTGAITETSFTASDRIGVLGNTFLSALTSAVKSTGGSSISFSSKENPYYEKSQISAMKSYNPTYAATMGMPYELNGQALRKSNQFLHDTQLKMSEGSSGLVSVIERLYGINSSSMPKVPSSDSYVIDQLNGTWTFYYELYTPNKKDMRNIDVYLNTFGYASNRVGKPNYNTREKWNYVKTKWCNLKDSRCPTDALVAIKNIVNNGIMFWHNEENVNNYVNSGGYPIANEVNV